MEICDTPATFQKLMNEILHDCMDEFLMVYTDVFLPFAKERESHYLHLGIVLERLREN